MKYLYLFLLIIILLFCTGFSNPVADIYISTLRPNTQKIEGLFKTYLPSESWIVYTKVPRGLVISINEDKFFCCGSAKIKESSLSLLDTIAMILKEIPNYCVIENHTEENEFVCSDYKDNWELSVARAVNVAQYLTLYKKLPVQRTFAIGYGEIMPFKDNVAPKEGMNNRIDFVIIEYEARR